MRISLIGAGDFEYHYHNLLGLEKDYFDNEVKQIAKTLVESDFELVLLPDRGICFEIAKLYKKFGGKKVLGTVRFQIKILESGI